MDDAMLKVLRFGAWAAAAVLAFYVGTASFMWYRHQSDTDASIPSVGGDFSLVDMNGERVSEADYLGRPRAMFFGFTHCPDVCPTTIYDFKQIKARLEDKADYLKFVIVTVDPERDDLAYLDEYLTAFDSEFVGLSGELETLEDVYKSFGVFRQKSITWMNGLTLVAQGRINNLLLVQVGLF